MGAGRRYRTIFKVSYSYTLLTAALIYYSSYYSSSRYYSAAETLYIATFNKKGVSFLYIALSFAKNTLPF